MKKILWLTLALLLICLFAFSACDNDNQPQMPDNNHIHEFDEWTTIQKPNCTDVGINERYCSCGEKQTQSISALGHTEVIDAAVAATCTTDGNTEGKHCSVCNEILVKPGVISALGHNYNVGEITKNASCIQEGTKTYTCINPLCQYSYNENYSLPQYSATELYNQSIEYVGEIVTYDKKGSEYALGTGFVISSDGKIVTNYHVIEGAYSATICIDGTTHNIVSVLAYDATIDLAVLKINANNLAVAKVCKNAVQVGETVYAIGSSRGMTNTYSQGIITYADRIVDGISHVQHDASITHGNSGGPLINVYGEVIGINTWGISDSQNLNFAVFADELDNLVYGTPITLSDLFQEQLTPYEYLTNWVFDNYTETYFDGQVISVEHINGEFVYSISYDLEYEYLYIDVYDDALYFSLDLVGDPSEYTYYFEYEYNSLAYSVEGIVNAKTFTENTALINYEYSGPSYNKPNAISLTQTAMCTTLSFFDYFLYTNDLGLSIEDFGFLSYN